MFIIYKELGRIKDEEITSYVNDSNERYSIFNR